MDDAIAWLNDNSGAVQAASVVVLVIVTGLYAKWTRDVASATKVLGEASDRSIRAFFKPRVRFNLGAQEARPDRDMISIDVLNEGNGPAFELDLDIQGLQRSFTNDNSCHHLPNGASSKLNLKGMDNSPVEELRFVLQLTYQDVEGNGFVSSQEVTKQDEKWVPGHFGLRESRDDP